MSQSSLSHEAAATVCDSVRDQILEVVVTDAEFIETVLTGVVGRGHVLLEDVPGTGKTLTAISVAQALNLEFSRIQFTPDLLPSDITGSHVFNESAGEFEFTKGPIFANVVLADEINRAPPKTQAALLEAMDEGQVTVDGDTHQLPEPFFVIATQNPVEQEGTFELPEAQRDRFMIKTSMGYPAREGELELIARRGARTEKMPSVDPVVDAETVAQLRMTAEDVTVDEQVGAYLVDLARATREDDRTKIGMSPRGIQRFYEAARARAVVAGREYVAPDDVKRIAKPVIQHRLVLTTDTRIQSTTGGEIVDDVVESVAVPSVTPSA